MKFGAAIWPFRWDPPYPPALERIAALGLKAVELIAWDRDALHEYYTPVMIGELRGRAEALGLEISEFVSTPMGMAHPDKAVRDESVEHFKEMVEVAHALGTNLLNSVTAAPFDLALPWLQTRPQVQLWTMDVPSGLDWDQNWNDYVDTLRRCAAICEDAGMRYALEAHPYSLGTTALSLLRLIDHVESEALGVNFDPSHLFPCGDMPHVAVYQLGGRIFHCHLSDNDGATNVHWRPGKGKIDWTAMLVALRDVGFDGVLSIELEDVPGVSRGAIHHQAGAYAGTADATEEFEAENQEGIAFLRDICDRNGIAIA